MLRVAAFAAWTSAAATKVGRVSNLASRRSTRCLSRTKSREFCQRCLPRQAGPRWFACFRDSRLSTELRGYLRRAGPRVCRAARGSRTAGHRNSALRNWRRENVQVQVQRLPAQPGCSSATCSYLERAASRRCCSAQISNVKNARSSVRVRCCAMQRGLWVPVHPRQL